MRITNRIMQRNNLSNINTNKIYQDKLSTQMSSQKKINRPSDDPVVAIRALRLRSNVTEITQYYTKNIPDAESWLKVTEDALSSLSQVITNMIAQCNKGVNSYLTTENRKIVLEELQNLSNEAYATGNADYAGRYVFTGYRTDTPLKFLFAETRNYEITEQIDKSAIDSVMKVDTGKLLDINSSTYAEVNVDEDDISLAKDVHRIRLAYNDCSEDTSSIEIKFQKLVDDGSGNLSYEPKTWPGSDGVTDIKMMHSYETNPNPYAYISDSAHADEIVFVPETGELLLGENRYKDLMATKDGESTSTVNEGEIQVTYKKSNWKKDDLRPEHYFYCKADREEGSGTIEYNANYLTEGATRQAIEYDVGYNQTIRVNSTADQCFQHGIGREIDDIMSAMRDVQDLEKVVADIKDIMERTTDEGALEKLQLQLDAGNKALTFAKDKEQSLFAGGVTALQKYLDDASICVTECGSRSSKLTLIKNRSQNQKTTYETLKSENEDIDITEVAIELSAAELTYDAALMAAGKVMQSTLLNFI